MSKSSEDLLLDFSLAGLIKIEGEKVITTEKLSKLLNEALFIVTEANKKHQLGLSEKEIRETIENILILDSIYAKPIELSIESLEKIYKLLNNKILFVSNRSEKIRKQTEDWLNLHIRNKFDYELILGDGSILSDKKDRLKGVHFYVDDAIEHVFSASKNIDSIINCFLFESKNVVYDYFRTVNDYTIRKLFKQNKIIRTTNWKIIVKHIEALFSTNKLTI